MTTPSVRVAIRLTPDQDNLGDWLADAAAFDSAGADSIWVELDAASGLDPLAVAAALAVVTSQARLVFSLDAVDRSADSFARAVDTIQRLSNDRLTFLIAPEGAADTGVASIVLIGSSDTADAVGPGVVSVAGPAVGSVVAESRTPEGATERWLSAGIPEDREAWQAICVQAAAREAAGVVVGAEEILLDLLRNPNPRGDRRDLNVASG